MASSWSLEQGPPSRRDAVVALLAQCGDDLPRPAIAPLAALCVDAIADGDQATIGAALLELRRIAGKNRRGKESPAAFTSRGRAEALMGLLSAAPGLPLVRLTS